MTQAPGDWFVETLGTDCSRLGVREDVQDGVRRTVAYVVFRGVLIAAAASDRAGAERALEAKARAHREVLASTPEIDAVEEINLVAGSGPEAVRRFVRPMSVERARLELELGCDGALVFLDQTTRSFAIISRGEADHVEVLRLGEPVHGDEAAQRPLPVPGRTPSAVEADRLRRDKAARIRPLLRCPECRGELDDAAGGLACAPCGRTFPAFEGRPVLAVEAGYDGSPRGVPESQNTYGQQVLSLIEKHRDGWVLDCGSGNPTLGFYNVVHLELSGYAHVDVVTDGRALPFADDTFDAVLSEAVLEHVRDPFAYTREVARVLKPGGLVRLDAAFLQPYHGYPDHYFNMTRSGLSEVVERSGLELVSIEPGPHQHPMIALSLVLNGFVQGTGDSERRQCLLDMSIGEAIQKLAAGGGPPFDGLGREAIDKLAAGFACLARKPAQDS